MAADAVTVALEGGSLGNIAIRCRAVQGDESDSTGCIMWPASFVLLSAAVEGLFAVDGCTVVELGSGAHGLVGRALKQWWPNSCVTLSDGDEAAVECLRSTAEAEGCAVEEVNWSLADGIISLGSCDLVVGTDLVYDLRRCVPLAETIANLMHGKNETWLAIEERDAMVIEAFFQALVRFGLQYERVECTSSVQQRAISWMEDAQKNARNSCKLTSVISVKDSTSLASVETNKLFLLRIKQK